MPNLCNNVFEIHFPADNTEGFDDFQRTACHFVNDLPSTLDLTSFHPLPTESIENLIPTGAYLQYRLNAAIACLYGLATQLESEHVTTNQYNRFFVRGSITYHKAYLTGLVDKVTEDRVVDLPFNSEESLTQLKGQPEFDREIFDKVLSCFRKQGYVDVDDWLYCNWGTKRIETDDFDIVSLNRPRISAYITTAWMPPVPLVRTIAQRYPEATIYFRWWELGNALSGAAFAQQGELKTAAGVIGEVDSHKTEGELIEDIDIDSMNLAHPHDEYLRDLLSF